MAAIRQRAEGLTASHADEDCDGPDPCTGHDALRMVEGFEALRRLADEWTESAEPWRQVASTAGLQIHCASTLREAITRALTGEDSSDGR